MKRVVIEPASEEVLFREMKKALPYMERGIDLTDLKRYRRGRSLDRVLGK